MKCAVKSKRAEITKKTRGKGLWKDSIDFFEWFELKSDILIGLV